jgi:hypothetical protein
VAAEVKYVVQKTKQMGGSSGPEHTFNVIPQSLDRHFDVDEGHRPTYNTANTTNEQTKKSNVSIAVIHGQTKKSGIKDVKSQVRNGRIK